MTNRGLPNRLAETISPPRHQQGVGSESTIYAVDSCTRDSSSQSMSDIPGCCNMDQIWYDNAGSVFRSCLFVARSLPVLVYLHSIQLVS